MGILLIFFSNLWLGNCTYGNSNNKGFNADVDIHPVDDVSCFFGNTPAQFPQTRDGRFFSMELVAVVPEAGG